MRIGELLSIIYSSRDGGGGDDDGDGRWECVVPDEIGRAVEPEDVVIDGPVRTRNLEMRWR